jgi:CubicO group peptidase (beta-lactamase class C family)
VNGTFPLKLNTPLSQLIEFVTEDDYVTTHATLEDALSHRTGIPRHDMSYGGKGATPESVVRNLRNLPLTTELRQEWQYCNMMFMTLSHVVEKLTKVGLVTYFRRHIWGPLGMDSTFLTIADAQKAYLKNPRAIVATPYYWDNETQQYIAEEFLDEPSISGAGATISSVMDYAKYLRAMLNNDPRILSELSYEELRIPRMFIRQLNGPGSPFRFASYTLAWQTAMYRGMQLFYHGGAVNGFGALMAYIPEKNFGLAIMANTEQTSNMIEDILALYLLDDLAGIPKEDRTDYSDLYKLQLLQREIILQNAVHILYPDVPKRRLPPTVSLESHAGTYYDEGYGTLELKLVNVSSIYNPHGFIKSDQVLHVEVRNKSWKHDLEIEHVTGEQFVIWIHSPNKGQDLFSDATLGEFIVGSNGEVSTLGIRYDSLMGKNRIWFRKQSPS